MGSGGYTPKATPPAEIQIKHLLQDSTVTEEGIALTVVEKANYGNTDGDNPAFAMPSFGDGPDCRCKS